MYVLGELEPVVMQVLWHASESVKVRDVRGKMDAGKPLAYTTVLTVLDSLHRKGLGAADSDRQGLLVPTRVQRGRDGHTFTSRGARRVR